MAEPRAPSPASRYGARGRVLEAYLDDLKRQRSAPPVRRTPHDVGRPWRDLLDDPWVDESIERYFDQREADVDACSVLVVHGIALFQKCITDLEELGNRRHERGYALYAAQAELTLDTAVGMALVRETQRTIDALLRKGQVTQARNLSKFHHRLRNAVFDFRRFIDEAERQTADDLVDHLSDSLPDDPPGDSLPEQDAASADRYEDAPTRESDDVARARAPVPATRTARRRKRARQPTEEALPAQFQTRFLAATLVLSAAVWFGTAHLPRMSSPGPASVELSSWDGSSGLRAVEDRRPSLFVVVDGAVWEELPADRREELVRHASREVAGQGYAGLLVRAEDGRPVAQWLQRTGVRLLEGSDADARMPTKNDRDVPAQI